MTQRTESHSQFGKHHNIAASVLINSQVTLEGGPLDRQLGVVADALSLAVVVVITVPVLASHPQPPQQPRPESS